MRRARKGELGQIAPIWRGLRTNSRMKCQYPAARLLTDCLFASFILVVMAALKGGYVLNSGQFSEPDLGLAAGAKPMATEV